MIFELSVKNSTVSLKSCLLYAARRPLLVQISMMLTVASVTETRLVEKKITVLHNSGRHSVRV